MTVTDEPITANPGTVTTTEGTMVSGTLSASDGDNDHSFSAGTVTTTHGGTAVIAGNGAFTYTPTATFTGSDSFSFTALDEGHSNTATETVTVTAVAPIRFSFNPDTPKGTLSALQGKNNLNANTAIGTFTETGGASGDSFSFSLGGSGASSFTLSSASNAGTLSTGANGVAGSPGGAVYALTVTITDTTTHQSSSALPFDVVVGSSQGNHIVLAANGISATTPTIVYGLDSKATLSATGMTAPVWLVGGVGANTMTGGSGVNTYLYGSTGESPPGTHGQDNNFDTITNFDTGSTNDVIDVSGISGITKIQGLISGNTPIAPNSVAWIQNGTDTDVYANASGSAEAQGSADMEIALSNFTATNLNGNTTANSPNFHLDPPGPSLSLLNQYAAAGFQEAADHTAGAQTTHVSPNATTDPLLLTIPHS